METSTTEKLITINHLETSGDMIRKISSAIESFGLTIDLVECEPEQTVYAIKVLK